MAYVLQEISFEEEDITKEVFVGFRIRSDILNPTALTSDLRIQPSRAWAKGDIIPSKRLNSQTGQPIKRPWGMWHLDSKSLIQTKKVEQHFLYLLDILEPQKDQLRIYLQRPTEYKISFYIRWQPYEAAGSYVVSANTLARAASLCHSMEFSFIHNEKDSSEYSTLP